MVDSARLKRPAALRHPLRWWLVWLTGATIAAGSVFAVVRQWQVKQDVAEAASRLVVLGAALHNEMSRHETLPSILSKDPRLIAALTTPGQPRLAEANAYLRFVCEQAGAEAVFLIDHTGLTLASSNAGEADSFVGENYAFRPYVIQALEHGTGAFYAVGATTTTRRPGYFLASAVEGDGRVLGVVAVKVTLLDFERSLATDEWQTVVANESGIAVLASSASLRYGYLRPLNAAQMEGIRKTRQFPEASLRPMFEAAQSSEPGASRTAPVLSNAPGRLVTHEFGRHGWQMVSFVNPPVQATLAAVSAALAFSTVVGLGLVAMTHTLRRERQREMREREEDIQHRIALGTLQLRQQVEEQARNAAVLRETSDSAVQAGKLAVLGQMSAAICHELNQPLTALRMFAENAIVLQQAQRTEAVRMNLQHINQLAERMGQILCLLRSHLRKQPGPSTEVPVREAIDSALALLQAGLKRAGEVEVCVEPPGLKVIAQRVRLEQVILNLVRNALEAQPSSRPPTVRAHAQGGRVVIEVEDSGPGHASHQRGVRPQAGRDLGAARCDFASPVAHLSLFGFEDSIVFQGVAQADRGRGEVDRQGACGTCRRRRPSVIESRR
jgi:two-component system C4-dicarboxylate transport sensor histidine kinase DctB